MPAELVDQVEQAAAKAEQAADAVQGSITEVQEVAAAATRRAEAAEAALAKANETLDQTAKRAEQAAAAAEQHLAEARASAEQAALEAEVARVQAEAAEVRTTRRAPSSASHPEPPRPEAAPADEQRAPLFGRKQDTGPARELREGFDDADQPLAKIALDGRFEELNKAFSELVGYSEQDFKQASWPPVMDRQNLPKHREQMRALLAGELAEAEINTGYVHAQGLLVPVVGTITLVRVDDEPDHFLLAVKRP